MVRHRKITPYWASSETKTRSRKLDQKYIFFFTFLCLKALCWMSALKREGLTSTTFEDRVSHSRRITQQQSYICLTNTNLFVNKLQRTGLYFTKKQVNLFMTNQVVTGNTEEDKICSWDLISRPQKKMTKFSKNPILSRISLSERTDSDLL